MKNSSWCRYSLVSQKVRREIDDRCDRFEAAWRTDDTPDPSTFIDGLHEEDRALLLRELVLLDLAFRWSTPGEEPHAADVETVRAAASSQADQADGRMLLEDYLARMPDLGALDDLPLAMIQEEYRLRKLARDDVSIEQYKSRFPRHANLATALREVERQLTGKDEPPSLALDDTWSPAPHAPSQLGDTEAFNAPAVESPAGGGERPRMFGDYELLGKLGHGGMGVVYKARQKSADRIVALKVIRPDRLSDYDKVAQQLTVERFANEARAAARLNHENVATVYDVGEAAGCHYYSMRFIDGQTLADRLRGSLIRGDDAARYLEPICRAVHFAHERNVLHRDLKPHNVLIEAATDRPLVTDFGLAKLVTGDAGLTETGERFGSPPYMSPEQAQDAATATEASDVYSLGAILYECLTGRPPFVSTSGWSTILQVIDNDPVPPRTINPDADRKLETIALKCLEKSPARRYESAAALADDLTRYRRGEPILARPPGLFELAAHKARRHQQLVAAVAAVLVVIVVATWMGIAVRTRAQARGAVDAILNAEPGELPTLIRSSRALSDNMQPLLREAFSNAADEGDSARKLRASLALLPDAPAQAEFLVRELLVCDVEMVPPILEMLRPYAESLTPGLWSEVGTATDARPQDVLRRAAALAAWDSHDGRWAAIVDPVAYSLAAEDSFSVARVWLDAFRPVSDRLAASLSNEYGKGDAQQDDTVAQIIADYSQDDPDGLVDLALIARPQHYSLIARHMAEASNRDLCVQAVEQFLIAGDETRRNAFRTANGVAVLCQLDGPHRVWDYLQWRRNPEVRSYLIERLTPDVLPPEHIVEQIKQEDDASVRRALLLILGNLPPESLPGNAVDVAVQVFRDAPDAGTHSAAEWALRQWGQSDEIVEWKQELAANAEDASHADRQWYVNEEGHTMVILEAGEFLMGSPPDEPGREEGETQSPRRINRRYAIATTEVTVEQFRRFLPDHKPDAKWSHSRDCPVGAVSWFQAAAYCNWLSQQEGIPEDEWCYPVRWTANTPFPRDYLSRLGYRLPTEAEWEFACRAGTITARYFGETDELLAHYAWHRGNALVGQPVGLLKPNDFGLFDMYGNAWEWCDDLVAEPQIPYPDGPIDDVGNDVRETARFHVARSETVEDVPDHMRSAMRTWFPLNGKTIATGFRVAKTEGPYEEAPNESVAR